MFKRFTSGFAIGYVVGAHAGEKRYDQIADMAGKLMDIPVVSRAAERAQDLATGENGRRLINVMKERVPFQGSPHGDEQAEGEAAGEPDVQEASTRNSPQRTDRRQATRRRSRQGRVGAMASSARERGRVY